MDSAQETVFLEEPQDTLNFKIVRLARACRAVQITNPQAHVLVVGYVSSRIRSDWDFNEAKGRLAELANKARELLLSFGVYKVAGYIYQIKAPVTTDFLALAVRDTAPVGYPGQNLPKQTAPGAAPAPGAKDDDDDDGAVKSEIAIDPFKKEVKAQFPKVELEIDVKFWDNKGALQVLPKKAKVTFDVDSKQIQDTALELQWAKDFLKHKTMFNVITKVEVGVTASARMKFDTDDRNRITSKFGAEIKAGVEVGLKIPNTPFKFSIEGNVMLDQAGKVTPGATLTIPIPGT